MIFTKLGDDNCHNWKSDEDITGIGTFVDNEENKSDMHIHGFDSFSDGFPDGLA